MIEQGEARSARVAVFPGDGIGPEVIREARETMDLAGSRFGFRIEWHEGLCGGAAIDACGDPLPPESLQMALAGDAVLLGAVGGPKWDDPAAAVRPEAGLLRLRKELQVFANLRPVRPEPSLLDASPLKREVVEGADILFVRELTGGIYFGEPSERRSGPEGRSAVDTCIYSEKEIQRVVRYAFELARSRRRKVISVDKANVLATSRLWREVTVEVAREFPDVSLEFVLVDAMAMHLLNRPRDFDVVVTENLFGDILTDEGAVLAGNLGMLPSAAVGEVTNRLGARRGLYEPVHGSAPDVAGRDLANPLAAILSGAMLLRYSLGQGAAAAAIERAVGAVIAEGIRTADIARSGETAVGCRAMGEAVRQRLAADAR